MILIRHFTIYCIRHNVLPTHPRRCWQTRQLLVTLWVSWLPSQCPTDQTFCQTPCLLTSCWFNHLWHQTRIKSSYWHRSCGKTYHWCHKYGSHKFWSVLCPTSIRSGSTREQCDRRTNWRRFLFRYHPDHNANVVVCRARGRDVVASSPRLRLRSSFSSPVLSPF